MPPHADPRSRYVEIATRPFASGGLHGVSLAALAREAGVSKQALLHFFGTKEALYTAVLTALADRQIAQVDAAAHPDPATQLHAYFQDFRSSAMTAPDDIRLVVRALLDSSEAARRWPLKPYLDRLITLTRQAQGDQPDTTHAILSGLSHVIGTIQYVAISGPAIAGMYGPDARQEVFARSKLQVAEAVTALIGLDSV